MITQQNQFSINNKAAVGSPIKIVNVEEQDNKFMSAINAVVNVEKINESIKNQK